MAGTAVLEREVQKQEPGFTKEYTAKPEERKNTANPAAYDFLHYSEGSWTSPSAHDFGAPVKEQERPAQESFASERIKSYVATPSAPSRKHELFADYAYVHGELLRKDPETDVMVPVFEAAPATKPTFEEEPFKAPAYTEPVQETVTENTVAKEDEDDALPTRRTLETVIRPAATVQEFTVTETKTGFRAAVASLSTKMKIIVMSVVAAIVLAIVLICVNTGIIRSLDNELSDLRSRAAKEQSTYETLQKESDLYTDPESEIVTEWAENNGMTK